MKLTYVEKSSLKNANSKINRFCNGGKVSSYISHDIKTTPKTKGGPPIALINAFDMLTILGNFIERHPPGKCNLPELDVLGAPIVALKSFTKTDGSTPLSKSIRVTSLLPAVRFSCL